MGGLVGANVSTKCIYQEEHDTDNGNEATNSGSLMNADMIRTSFDSNNKV